MAINEDIMLTRVAIPINYRDPILVRKISELRETLVASKTPECRIREEVNQLVDSWKGAPNPYTISFLGRSLLSHSAQKIYIIDLSQRLNESMLTGLPAYLKPRIELIDSKKIYESVFDMLKPINNDLAPLWRKVRAANGASKHDINGHEHGYCLLGEFLVTLTIAIKYNTEADIDLGVVSQAIARIKRQAQSQESQVMISRIEGILNCYRSARKIPSISPAAQIIPKDLLADLLDDAAIISLSKERYYFGVPSKTRIAFIKTRQKIREILSVPKYRKYLLMGTKIGNIATKQVNIELPEIDLSPDGTFSPPFISLNHMKPSCLQIERELSDIDPFKIV